MTDAIELKVQSRSQSRSLQRLSALVRRSIGLVWDSARRPFVELVAVQLIAAAATACTVLAVKLALDGILGLGPGSSTVTALIFPVGLLALLTASASVTGAVQNGLQRIVGERVAMTMWQRVFAVSTAVGLKDFETPDFQDRLRRVQTNGLTRPHQLTQGLITALSAGAASLGLVVAIMSLNPVLLPLILLSGIPALVSGRKQSRMEFEFTVAQTASARLRGYLTVVQTRSEEAKEVRAFDLAGSLRRRFGDVYRRYLTDLRAHVRRRTAWSIGGGLASAVVLAATMIVLVWMIAGGHLSVAAAGAALVAVRSLAGQLPAVTGGIGQVYESGLFLDDVDQFIALGRQDAEGDGSADPTPEFSEIAARGVGFSYPTGSGPVLSGVDLVLRRGEVVALVGENGSGKSTLAKIIAGLYLPDTGSVSWDGIDSRNLRRAGVLANSAVIFQDFARFAFTAQENIALVGDSQVPDLGRVQAAAAATGAGQVIDSLPQGYDTPLSTMFTGGQNLSGGQWQRIALARAYYRDAPLVILDEPTSSLDPRAEHDLFASLRKVLAGRTALFISHRFSTVRSADRIYVMDQGRVIESGTHDELMALDCHYAELFRLQADALLDRPLQNSARTRSTQL